MRTLHAIWTLCVVALLSVVVTPVSAQQSSAPQVETKGPTSAATCGVSSGNFGRICRPGSNKRCLDAVKRGVKGFSKVICADRREACETCLGRLQRCFRSKIDITTPMTKKATCDRCETRYTSCMRRIYPGYSK
jgi:hypothetical protein